MYIYIYIGVCMYIYIYIYIHLHPRWMRDQKRATSIGVFFL